MTDWSFDSEAIRTFRFVRCGFDPATGVARLVYAFDEGPELVETVTLPGAPFALDGTHAEAVERALRLLHLVAEAGVLLLSATQVVDKDGVRRVGCDAGMNALLRPALYDAWHEVVNLSRLHQAQDASFDIVGPVCESGDVLARQRRLPAATAEGDVILVADAGAYGMAMANTYNLRALPAEDVLDD